MANQPKWNVPHSWEDYERGLSPRQGSIGSETSHVHFDEGSPAAVADRLEIPRSSRNNDDIEEGSHQRRSSFSMRVRHLGGVNSLENFARSWQRAAGFNEIPSSRPSFVFSGEDDSVGGRHQISHPVTQQTSLLGQQLEREGVPSETAIDDGPTTPRPSDEEFGPTQSPARSYDPRKSDIFGSTPYLASSFASSYGGQYGSLASRVNSSSMRHAGKLYKEQQATGEQEPDKDHQPLLLKAVEREDGKIIHVVVGQSTLPQTVFNSVNVLVGVGILSLPLGVHYSGWLLGMPFLLLSALATRYTARTLAKCLDVDNSLVTFADIAYIAFGWKARIATSVIFTVELLGACVALVVVFADSLDALIPGWSIVEWKVFCGAILIPLSFIPLRFLSFTSVLGTTSCLGIIILVFVDGLLKAHPPGSLRQPATTHLLPATWSTLPLSFGLLMSPWSGHSVFPNIYRDMRHPHKYPKAVNNTYIFTYLVEISMAVVGLLMFGDRIRDEITFNILTTDGYPHALSVCIVIFIAIVPLTKVPLNARPIFVTIEVFCGLHARSVPTLPGILGLQGYTRGLLKCSIRAILIIVITLIAILVPSFDIIMTLMGSAMCSTISIVLPLSFYLKIFGTEISRKERALDWFLIIFCLIMASICTVWVFLPQHSIGGR